MSRARKVLLIMILIGGGTTLAVVKTRFQEAKARRMEQQEARAKIQRELVEPIQTLGGQVIVGCQCAYGGNYVWFGDTEVTDDMLARIKDVPHIDALDVSGTRITDTGLAHVGSLTQLKGLRLNNTNVTDNGLDRLKGLIELKYLSLEGTRVTDDGIKKLKETLPECEIQN